MLVINPDIKSLTKSNGIQFNVGDLVTCYYKGYYRIIGFSGDVKSKHLSDKEHEEHGRFPILVKEYDINGKPSKTKPTCCSIEYLGHYMEAVNASIKTLELNIKQLTKLKLA